MYNIEHNWEGQTAAYVTLLENLHFNPLQVTSLLHWEPWNDNL
jgi:hypothetical protein